MKRLILMFVACAVLAVAGCGGGGDSSSGSTAAAGSTRTEATAATGSTGTETTATESARIEEAGSLKGPEPKVVVPKGTPPESLVAEELRKGSGKEAQTGDKVTIQFVGTYFNGKPYESSWKFGVPFRFQLGAKTVSAGWEKGIPGMRVGGRRELIIPANLFPRPGVQPEGSPKDAKLYVVDLLEVS